MIFWTVLLACVAYGAYRFVRTLYWPREVPSTLGGNAAVLAIDAAGEGNVQPALELIRSAPDRATRDLLIPLLMDKCPSEPILAWRDREPDSALAALCVGVRLTHQAWEIRTSALGKDISDEQARGFLEKLDAADHSFARAASLDPRDPAAWAFRIRAAMGLGADVSDGYALFHEATARDPENWEAHARLLNLLSGRWCGTHEEMFAFARKVAQSAAAGSDLPALLFSAHILRWNHYDIDGEKGSHAYLKNAEVRAELDAAYAKSLGHPSLRVRPQTAYARNVAAAWFYLIDDKQRCRRELLALDGAYDEFPWYWVTGGLAGALEEVGIKS